MKIKFASFLLFYSITHAAMCCGFGIQLTTLYNPQTNDLIGFIGDLHSITPQELEKEKQFDAAFFCDDLKNILINNDCQIFFEGSNAQINHQIHAAGYETLYGLNKLCQLYITHQNHYIPSDIRTNTLEILIKIYIHFNTTLQKTALDIKCTLENKFHSSKDPLTRFLLEDALHFCNTNDALTIVNTYLYKPQKHITEDEVLTSLKKQLYYPYDTQTPITLSTLRQAFNQNTINIFLALIKLQLKKPEYTQIIQKLHANLLEIHKEGEAYFATLQNQYASNLEITALFIELGKPHQTIAYSFGNTAENPFKKFYFKLLLDYPDIYFTAQALARKNSFIFAGNYHCTAIVKNLVEQGFTKLYDHTINPYAPYQPQEITKFIAHYSSTAKSCEPKNNNNA